MWDFSNTTEPVARKDYHCDASDWITNGLPHVEDEVTQEDMVIIKKAEAEKWRIKKGTKYIKTTGIWEGEFCTFRARPDLDAICKKYDLYVD